MMEKKATIAAILILVAIASSIIIYEESSSGDIEDFEIRYTKCNDFDFQRFADTGGSKITPLNKIGEEIGRINYFCHN